MNTTALWNSLRTQISKIPNPPGVHGQSTFGHIMGGYDASYYGYMYSQVFSADLFQKFKEGGLMNSEIGSRYRKMILSCGGSRDSLDSIKLFLGREPNNIAFLKSVGLSNSETVE